MLGYIAGILGNSITTAIDDGSEMAELMSCFTKTELENPKFPAVTSRFRKIKTTEGGLRFLTKEAAFHGFSYSGNCLQGDYSKLVKILSPMAEAPIHKKNCFKHEVAVLLLTHYYFQKGKYRMKGYVRIRFRQFLIFLKNKKRRVPKSREEK